MSAIARGVSAEQTVGAGDDLQTTGDLVGRGDRVRGQVG